MDPACLAAENSKILKTFRPSFCRVVPGAFVWMGMWPVKIGVHLSRMFLPSTSPVHLTWPTRVIQKERPAVYSGCAKSLWNKVCPCLKFIRWAVGGYNKRSWHKWRQSFEVVASALFDRGWSVHNTILYLFFSPRKLTDFILVEVLTPLRVYIL